MPSKLAAEFLGTFVLVFGGCGAAVFGGAHEAMGLTGVALAFGLAVFAMAVAVGPVSGGHFNPAVTLGLVAAGRHPAREAVVYIVAQLAGAFTASAVLALVLHESGHPLGQFAANGWGADGMHNALSVIGALLVELVATFVFLLVILGATATPSGPLAPLAIGLCLTLVHLVTIPLTNTSVNPARSTSQAAFAGGVWLDQLWLFWAAPIAGAVAAGLAARVLYAPASARAA